MLDEDDKDIQEQQEEEVSSPENDESEAKSSQKEASDKDTEDTDDTDSGKKTSEDELADYSESVKKRINKLTYKAREAERRELEALEYAKAVKLELDGLRKRETTLNKSFESEAETRLSAQEQLFRDQLKFSVDSGDVDKQVEMQTSLVRLASERERLRNYRCIS